MKPLRSAPALLVLFAAAAATAQPEAGAAFPVVPAQDISGATHPTVLAGGEVNLVVVITDRGAEKAMRAWFAAADARAPKDVHRVSIASLKLPFFVSVDMMRGHARSEAPREHWAGTFVDRDGRLAKELNLPSSREPFVFAVGPDGTVKAAAHGPADGAEAEAIWNALN